jgi:hypothetical protein
MERLAIMRELQQTLDGAGAAPVVEAGGETAAMGE